jgi:hypothetical protein
LSAAEAGPEAGPAGDTRVLGFNWEIGLLLRVLAACSISVFGLYSYSKFDLALELSIFNVYVSARSIPYIYILSMWMQWE